MQRLILPFKSQMMLCGYKNEKYLSYWGYPHYGVDISTIQGNAGSDHTIYASGNGEVVAVGKDNSLGWGISILYKDCLNHHTDGVYDLVARYMHMSSVFVEVGQKVVAGTPLAPEGKEGTGDYHLHIEFDTDTEYPTYSPQVSAGHTFWKKGIDSSVNPSFLFHVGKGQEVVKPTYNPEWLNQEDFKFPEIPDEVNYKVLYESTLKDLNTYKDKFRSLKDSISNILDKY